MKLIALAKYKTLTQLPDCQNEAQKSFFDVIFTDFAWKSVF